MLVWIQTVAALATVVIAVFAYNIDFKLQAQEKILQEEIATQEARRAAVSRSVALYRDFTESDAVQSLRRVAHKIHHRLWEKGQSGLKKNAVAIFQEKEFKELSSEIRGGLIEILQNIKVIYRCGKFEHRHGKKGKLPKGQEPLCDQETIFVLLGALLSEIHTTFRPVIYCDSFFKERYLKRDEVSGHITMFENLVKEHTVTDFKSKGVDWKVYLTENKRQDAIDNNMHKKGDSNWSILRTPDDRCALYPSQ